MSDGKKMVEGKVIALRRGFDGKQIREGGEEFFFKGVLGDWMKEAGDPIKEDAPKLPENWQDMHWKTKVKLAKEKTGLDCANAEEAEAALKAFDK